jgi:hypothetical protein
MERIYLASLIISGYGKRWILGTARWGLQYTMPPLEGLAESGILGFTLKRWIRTKWQDQYEAGPPADQGQGTARDERAYWWSKAGQGATRWWSEPIGASLAVLLEMVIADTHIQMCCILLCA